MLSRCSLLQRLFRNCKIIKQQQVLPRAALRSHLNTDNKLVTL